jgi:hypothetical protein
VVIKNSADAIWDYVYNPENWTASNADEHLGLVFFNRENRPATGVAFHQKEKVAGVLADLRGHILYVEQARFCIWTGVARYKLFGFLPLSVPENGVVRLEPSDEGTRMSHTVFVRVPDTLLGKLFLFFVKRYEEKPGFVPHAYKELLYFKEKLDRKEGEYAAA